MSKKLHTSGAVNGKSIRRARFDYKYLSLISRQGIIYRNDTNEKQNRATGSQYNCSYMKHENI